ncbi:MAG: ABC transporter ATP-binding protein [Lachnospiraceae bacterium]
MEKFLSIENLSVTYTADDETVYAVDGLNLEIGRGETLGLVGETGAGKTTTALGILRLLPERVGKITGGSIIFQDTDLVQAPDQQMRMLRGDSISMIFQDPMTSLNPVITVGDQIAEVLQMHNKDKLSHEQIWARVDEILSLVGLPPERKDEYPHQFSGGMKQRIVIAIALACQPQLLLADEPTTALDVTIQAQVLAMMKELQARLGTAMLLITHDLGVVAQTCDRVAIMYAGEIIEIGTVEQVFDDGAHHPYTIGLFGSIPNLKKSTRRLSPIDGLMPDPTVIYTGCKFAERCPWREAVCEEKKPQNYSVEGRVIKCHRYAESGTLVTIASRGKEDVKDAAH